MAFSNGSAQDPVLRFVGCERKISTKICLMNVIIAEIPFHTQKYGKFDARGS